MSFNLGFTPFSARNSDESHPEWLSYCLEKEEIKNDSQPNISCSITESSSSSCVQPSKTAVHSNQAPISTIPSSSSLNEDLPRLPTFRELVSNISHSTSFSSSVQPSKAAVHSNRASISTAPSSLSEDLPCLPTFKELVSNIAYLKSRDNLPVFPFLRESASMRQPPFPQRLVVPEDQNQFSNSSSSCSEPPVQKRRRLETNLVA